MPTYHYRCKQCQFEFEEFQKITDSALETCPRCHGRVERVISGGAGLLFKGDGFYITDNRSEGYKKEAKKEAPKSDVKPTDSKSDGPAKKSGGGSSSDS